MALDDPASSAGPMPPAPWLGELWPRVRPWLLGALGIALATAIGFALHGLLHEVRYADVMAAIHATPPLELALALAATALSYLALTFYDSSSLRYAGAQVRRSTVLLTSFVAYALGNTIGLGPLTGGAVRMRLYAAAGLQPPQITRAIVFNAAAFALGITAFGALGLLWGAPDVAPLLRLPAALLRGVALAALLALALFLVLCGRSRSAVAGRCACRCPAWRCASS